ncbi:SRPBCC domain-containing protein [Cellulosimicrobium funkei]|uniref:ATPase n=1 Tax=Cellulosimicrobium funkei TaxID=264251 RepID=A0A4Y8R867_9MICO|nr:SRPBCC domain-containing protein [Cellulosimicrobium funkei]TFF17364.1 ATPase [Cellulosimicrobium funkei]TGA74108.1 ATPase [Cellulosimicrobium terreum]
MTTTNEPAAVDAASYTVSRTVTIDAPAARVWAALTQEDLISRWFGQRTSLPDLRVGGEGVFSWPDVPDVQVRIEEYDPTTTFAFRWGTPVGQPLDETTSTVARFTLEPQGPTTVLRVVETGFERTADPDELLESHRQGWTSELDELVELLEGALAGEGGHA